MNIRNELKEIRESGFWVALLAMIALIVVVSFFAIATIFGGQGQSFPCIYRMNNYNVDWVKEWDRERLHKKFFEALGILYSFIYCYVILLTAVGINIYMIYLFYNTFNIMFPIIGILILAIAVKSDRRLV